MLELPWESVGVTILILFALLCGASIIGAISYLRYGWAAPPHTRLPYPVLDGLIALSVLGILVVTLWPSSGLGGTRIHLLPLSGFWEEDPYGTSLVWGIIGATANLLLFIPLGFLVGIRWRAFDKWTTVLALGIGLSLGVEILQFGLGGHDSSFDDVFLNALGAVCGHALMRLLYHPSGPRRAPTASPPPDCDS
jgi:glycopeptide antibiotics resistance protein